MVAVGFALPLYGLPSLGQLASAPSSSYGAGILIGFYALSATMIIPRFGAGNFVAFILIAQLATAAIIDQFGFFDVPRNPLGMAKLGGLALIVCGVVLVQLAGQKVVTR